jgi:low affinity Fe/Cu permease
MLKKVITRWTQLKPIRKFSDILFVVAVGISLYTLISTTLLRNSLPPGVCPINNKSEFYFLSIALLIASIVLSLFDKKGNA